MEPEMVDTPERLEFDSLKARMCSRGPSRHSGTEPSVYERPAGPIRTGGAGWGCGILKGCVGGRWRPTEPKRGEFGVVFFSRFSLGSTRGRAGLAMGGATSPTGPGLLVRSLASLFLPIAGPMTGSGASHVFRQAWSTLR